MAYIAENSMIKIPVGPRAYVLGRKKASACGGVALRGGDGAVAVAGQRVVQLDGERRRVYRLASATAKLEGQGGGPAAAAGNISIDSNGFHEIRESVEQSEDHTLQPRGSVSGGSNFTRQKADESQRTKADVMARLDELARLEAKAAEARTAADYGPEIAALSKRVKEIKSVDDYDEDDERMSRLQLNATVPRRGSSPSYVP